MIKADELSPRELTLRAYRDEMRGASGAVCLVGYAHEGKLAAQPLTLEDAEPGDRLPLVASLDWTTAQILMDTLYACGVRPTEAAGSAGQRAAMEKHLNDMRAIVAKALALTLP